MLQTKRNRRNHQFAVSYNTNFLASSRRSPHKQIQPRLSFDSSNNLFEKMGKTKSQQNHKKGSRTIAAGSKQVSPAVEPL